MKKFFILTARYYIEKDIIKQNLVRLGSGNIILTLSIQISEK